MHHRKRHIEKIMLKRAKMFPAIGVLGPRQVGKSTFLMKQWGIIKKAVYITFDKMEVASRAKSAPEQLLYNESNNLKTHLIIDEAQKVPHIFDSIKALIDENRRVNMFTLSGSIEFSSKSGIRESLAGRIGLTRLYPMTLRELNEQNLVAPWVTFNFTTKNQLTAKSIETWLERGGMPIFCCFSDLSERIASIQSWVEAICYRDLNQLKDAKYDGDLAISLLRELAAKSDAPINIKKLEALGSSKAIKKHLSALESLFLVYRIPSFENPRAQPMYKIFDAGVINALLGGHETIESRRACFVSLLINEIYSQYEYSGKLKPNIYYYRTRGGAELDLVLETNKKLIGIECTTSVDISTYSLRGMHAFLKKYENAIGYILAPVQKAYKIDKRIFVIPWNEIG